MMKKMISAALAAAAILVSAGKPSDFNVPDSWKPKVILGRDFWMIGSPIIFRGDKMVPSENSCMTAGDAFYPLEKASPGIRKLASIPAFYDTAKILGCFYTSTRKNPDGTYSFLLPKIPDHKLITDYPFSSMKPLSCGPL